MAADTPRWEWQLIERWPDWRSWGWQGSPLRCHNSERDVARDTPTITWLLFSLHYCSWFLFTFSSGPRGFTFTWWGCCDQCLWHKPTELAHSLFILFLCLFLSLLPFQLYFILLKFLPTTLRFLTLFFRSYFCLTGPFNSIPLYESLPQPWYNPLWLTGIKAPTNQLTKPQFWPKSLSERRKTLFWF